MCWDYHRRISSVCIISGAGEQCSGTSDSCVLASSFGHYFDLLIPSGPSNDIKEARSVSCNAFIFFETVR